MCCSCGCLKPNVEHVRGDIILSDLEAAAGAAHVSVAEAANNIPRTLRQATGQSAAESYGAALERPTLFVDMDNVLCDLTSAVAVGLNVAFDTEYVGTDFTVYSWASVVPSRMIPWLNGFLRTPSVYRNLSPIEGGVHTIRRAHAAGYAVNIVTDRHPELGNATAEWLGYHEVPYDHLGMRLTGGTKLTYLADYGPDNPAVLIEDNPTYLQLAPRPGVEVWSPKLPYTPSVPGVFVFNDWHQVRRRLGI